MAERSPIFSTKEGRPQIGYIKGDEAFDLFGRVRCNYSAATGNLFNRGGKIVGHVSLEGNFVGVAWIADELFGQRQDGEARADLRSIDEIPASSEEGLSAKASAAGCTDAAARSELLPETFLKPSDNIPNEPDLPESPVQEEDLLERAIRMIQSGLKKGPL